MRARHYTNTVLMPNPFGPAGSVLIVMPARVMTCTRPLVKLCLRMHAYVRDVPSCLFTTYVSTHLCMPACQKFDFLKTRSERPKLKCDATRIRPGEKQP